MPNNEIKEDKVLVQYWITVSQKKKLRNWVKVRNRGLKDRKGKKWSASELIRQLIDKS